MKESNKKQIRFIICAIVICCVSCNVNNKGDVIDSNIFPSDSSEIIDTVMSARNFEIDEFIGYTSCPFCEGNSTDDETGWKCVHCYGTGKRTVTLSTEVPLEPTMDGQIGGDSWTINFEKKTLIKHSGPCYNIKVIYLQGGGFCVVIVIDKNKDIVGEMVGYYFSHAGICSFQGIYNSEIPFDFQCD